MSAKKDEIEDLKRRIADFEQQMARCVETETELLKSKEMLQLVIDNIPQRVFWKDCNGVFLGCNMRFATDAGLEYPSAIRGMTEHDQPVKEFDAELHRKAEAEAIASGKPQLNIEEPLNLDGSPTIWLRTNRVPFFDNDGKVAGVLVTFEDITEQRNTLRQLAESEQRYRMLFDNANDAILIVDQKLNIVDANPKGCELFGYSRSQLLKKKADTLAASRLPLPSSEGNLFETKALHPDGRELNVEVSLSQFVHDGKTLYFAIVRDITERKNALDQLNAREETVRSIINASVEPMMLIEPDGRILNLNETAAMRLEATAEKVIGCNFYDFVDCGTAELRRKYVDLAIQWAMPVRFEETNKGVLFETSIHPVFADDGAVSRLAIFCRDYTLQKKKETLLQAEQLKYRTLFHRLTCASVLFDSEAGIIREVNNQMERMLGRAGDDINGMHFSELFGSDFMHECQELLERATEEENLHELFLAALETGNGDHVEVVVAVRNMWIDNRCYMLAVFQEVESLKSLFGSASNPMQ